MTMLVGDTEYNISGGGGAAANRKHNGNIL